MEDGLLGQEADQPSSLHTGKAHEGEVGEAERSLTLLVRSLPGRGPQSSVQA